MVLSKRWPYEYYAVTIACYFGLDEKSISRVGGCFVLFRELDFCRELDLAALDSQTALLLSALQRLDGVELRRLADRDGASPSTRDVDHSERREVDVAGAGEGELAFHGLGAQRLGLGVLEDFCELAQGRDRLLGHLVVCKVGEQ